MKGQAALYLSLDPITALAECTQGFALRMLPLTLCEYDVDCADIADLTQADMRRALGIAEADIACPWLSYQRRGVTAPSQHIAQRLIAEHVNGILVPSFVPNIHDKAVNLVLWRWSDALPCKIMVYDPDHHLPQQPA